MNFIDMEEVNGKNLQIMSLVIIFYLKFSNKNDLI